jgi:hypothetical protein
MLHRSCVHCAAMISVLCSPLCLFRGVLAGRSSSRSPCIASPFAASVCVQRVWYHRVGTHSPPPIHPSLSLCMRTEPVAQRHTSFTIMSHPTAGSVQCHLIYHHLVFFCFAHITSSTHHNATPYLPSYLVFLCLAHVTSSTKIDVSQCVAVHPRPELSRTRARNELLASPISHCSAYIRQALTALFDSVYTLTAAQCCEGRLDSDTSRAVFAQHLRWPV